MVKIVHASSVFCLRWGFAARPLQDASQPPSLLGCVGLLRLLTPCEGSGAGAAGQAGPDIQGVGVWGGCRRAAATSGGLTRVPACVFL